jgi:hypothetical protein
MGLMIFAVLVLAGECFLVHVFVQLVREGRRNSSTQQFPIFDLDARPRSEPRRMVPGKVTPITVFRCVGGEAQTQRRASRKSQEKQSCSL